jgi:sortase (surface protein transpeptidase)
MSVRTLVAALVTLVVGVAAVIAGHAALTSSKVSGTRVETATRPAAPLALEIPAIGLRSDGLVGLGIGRDGALEVPAKAETAGWYDLSPVPGEPGPAVIAGHVNWSGTPGVFSRLHELEPGAEVDVHRTDGRVAVFTVERVEEYAKKAFPTEEVYGNTDGPELRLITCGGAFNRATGHYVDNLVAYARLTALR